MEEYLCPMRFRHISNAGVILELGDLVIGIDVFTESSIPPYRPIPDRFCQELLWGGRFPVMDLLLVTHAHRDHFCPALIYTYLKNHPKTRFWGDSSVRRLLERSGVPPAQVVPAISLANQDSYFSMGHLEFYLLRTPHMGSQADAVPHHSVLIKWGHSSVLIFGDARPKDSLYRQVSLYTGHLEAMLSPFPVLSLRSARKCLLSHFLPRQIFLLHFPDPCQDEGNWIENTKKACTDSRDALPVPVFCLDLGQSYPLSLHIL